MTPSVIKRIVVGYDDSEDARRAAEWAAAAGRHLRADVLLLAASMPGSGDHLRLDRAIKAERWRLVPADAAAGPVATAITDVAGGDPRQVLAGAARTHGADLLVVGRAGGTGSPGLLHLGSVAEFLAHHATIPLVVVPASAAPSFDRIVVAVDGSPASRSAVTWCSEFARATGADVTAVMVHEPLLEWTPESDPEGWHRDAERRIRDELAPELVQAGIDVTAVALRGRRPVDGILAATAAPDLIVLGVAPTNRVVRVRVGGTAFGVLHDAECAVALIPGPT